MKKPTKKIDCLGLGIIPFDLLFNVKKYPSAEMKINAESFLMQGGGPVPNVMIGLSRLGFKTGLIAPIGDDPFGKILLDELKRDKVNTRYMVIKNKATALASGWIEQGSGRRTMVLAREVFVKPSDIKLAELPIPKLIHLDGRDIDATMKLAKWAKKNNAVVSFDIGSVRNDVHQVFPYVDHLVVADQYAYNFSGTPSPRQAIKKLAEHCRGTIVVTEGIKGSTGREAGSDIFINQKAYKVTNIDTTGAGDCYHSGYLYGLLKGYDLSARMKLGSAAAAIKCTKPGARSGIPNEKQLLKFMKSNPVIY